MKVLTRNKKPKKTKTKSKSGVKYSFWKSLYYFVVEDSYIKGLLLIFIALLLSFINFFPKVFILSTVYGYTFGFLFGQFGILIYIWWLWIGVVNLFKKQITNAYYEQKNRRFRSVLSVINIFNYLLVITVVILFVVMVQGVNAHPGATQQGNFSLYWADFWNSFTNSNNADLVAYPGYLNNGVFVALIFSAISSIYNNYIFIGVFLIYLIFVVIWFSRYYIFKKYKAARAEAKVRKYERMNRVEQKTPKMKFSKKTISMVVFENDGTRSETIVDSGERTMQIRSELGFEGKDEVTESQNQTTRIVVESASPRTLTFGISPDDSPELIEAKGTFFDIDSYDVHQHLSINLKTGKEDGDVSDSTDDEFDIFADEKNLNNLENKILHDPQTYTQTVDLGDKNYNFSNSGSSYFEINFDDPNVDHDNSVNGINRLSVGLNTFEFKPEWHEGDQSVQGENEPLSKDDDQGFEDPFEEPFDDPFK